MTTTYATIWIDELFSNCLFIDFVWDPQEQNHIYLFFFFRLDKVNKYFIVIIIYENIYILS